MQMVSNVLAMDRTTLTANLKPLERRGLVSVAADEADKRVRRLSLTDAGRKTLAEAYPIWEKTQAEIGGILEHTDPESLLAQLRALS